MAAAGVTAAPVWRSGWATAELAARVAAESHPARASGPAAGSGLAVSAMAVPALHALAAEVAEAAAAGVLPPSAAASTALEPAGRAGLFPWTAREPEPAWGPASTIWRCPGKPSRPWFPPAVLPSESSTAGRPIEPPARKYAAQRKRSRRCADAGSCRTPVHQGSHRRGVIAAARADHPYLRGPEAGLPTGADGAEADGAGADVCSASSATLVKPPRVIVPITSMIRP